MATDLMQYRYVSYDGLYFWLFVKIVPPDNWMFYDTGGVSFIHVHCAHSFHACIDLEKA